MKKETVAIIALKYNKIIAMKRTERSALVKGMDVVYIYHDTIDEASHTSDTAVFSACDKAISELKKLVRIIVNEFGGTNILITADHRFLYTYSPLTEDDKVDKTGFNDMDKVEFWRSQKRGHPGVCGIWQTVRYYAERLTAEVSAACKIHGRKF